MMVQVRKREEIIKPVLRVRLGDFDMRQNFVVSDLGSLKICLLLGGGRVHGNMIHASRLARPPFGALSIPSFALGVELSRTATQLA